MRSVTKADSRRAGGFWRIFRAPLVLGLLSSVGLISALLADGPWDVLSWLTLAVPLATLLWAYRYRWRRPN